MAIWDDRGDNLFIFYLAWRPIDASSVEFIGDPISATTKLRHESPK